MSAQSVALQAETVERSELTRVQPESGSARGELSRDQWRTERMLSIEQTKLLVHRLFLSIPGPRSVTFAGLLSNSGCTPVMLAAAEMLAVSTNSSICLVDGNAHNARIHTLYDLASTEGLSDALVNGRPVSKYIQRLHGSSLSILPYGRQPLLETEKRGRCFWMRDVLRGISKEFDYVLVDTPALADSSDAITFSSVVDGITLIVQAGKTRRDAASAAVSSLKQSGVNVLGAVMTSPRTLSE